jgi:AcrR family transcriptional regulator
MPTHQAATPSGTGDRPRRRYAPRMPADARREQLLDGALNVILECGYSGISIEAVARSVDVTRPVVYDHFPNLGSLLQALIEREERYAIAQLEQVLPEGPGQQEPSELLGRGVRRFLDAVASRPATWTLILLPLEGTPAFLRKQIETQREQMLRRIEQFVDWALERPEIPRELDAELTARTIRDFGEQAGRMVLTDGGRFSPQRYEQFVAAVMSLVWPRSGASRRAD